MKIKKPEMMKKAEISNKWLSRYSSQIICFIAVFIAISILESIPIMVFMFKDIFNASELTDEFLQGLIKKYEMPTGNLALIMLFITVFSIIIPILYCKFIEKRSLSSMGIVKKHAIRNYLLGLIIGFIMFSLVVLLNVVFGGMSFSSITSKIMIPYIIIYLIAYGIQGMSEEVLCRGYLMNSIGGKHRIGLAIITSSLIFALLHIFNPGITILAFFNLLLFGVFAALYMICFDNIWGVAAIHSIWNFAQGIIYGISVSGIYNAEHSIFLFKNVEEKAIINGGTFGSEGGIAVTIALLLSIVITTGIMIYKKKIELKNESN